jgi:RNA polymerase sigma-70 factor (ECF subfamily)
MTITKEAKQTRPEATAGHKQPVQASELLAQHFEAVHAFVSRRVRPREDAEDVTSETFTAAFRSLGKVRGDPRIWLYGIARRKIADLLRRRSIERKHAPRFEEGETPDPYGLAVANEAAQELRAAVEQLPFDQREALLLQYLEELSVTEIASVMNRSAKSVKGLLARARESLQAKGRSYFNDPEDIR